MQKIASNYLLGTMTYSTRANGTNVKKVASKDFVSLYGAEGHGFVVVSKDDDFTPVLGVSSTDYNPGNMPCGFNWWLSQIDESLKIRKANGESYQAASYSTSSGTYFLQTYWDQEEPFNLLCPKINNKKTYTGCLATAMAQIMFYFKYPESGKGIGTYTLEDDETPQQVEINSVYDWSNMKLRYTTYTDATYAVSTLMRDAGAACKMNYGTESSGAKDIYSVSGFCDNFRYDSLSINRYSRTFYTDAEWMEMIKTELEAKRPILYCGVDNASGGHAFVFDGIREDGKVHVNWGWSGSGNGWYDINALKPYKLGYPLVSGDGFNSTQSMTIGYNPQETPDATEENHSVVVTDGYEVKADGDKLTISLINFYNYCFREFRGTVDLVFQNASDKDDIETLNMIDTEEDGNGVALQFGYGYRLGDDKGNAKDYDLSEDLSELPSGTYKVYMASKSTSESSYQYVRSYGGPIVYNLTKATDGTYKVDLDDNSSTGIDLHIVKESDLTTTRFYDLNGHLLSGEPSAHGIFIMKQGNKTKKIIK